MNTKQLVWVLGAMGLLALIVMLAPPLFAQNGNTWNIQYFNNPNWAGSPVQIEYSPYIDFNWGTNPPAAGVPSGDWTAMMTSQAYFDNGSYTFVALADDEVILSIDGNTYINTIGAGMSGKTIAATVTLSEGYHNLSVNYRQYTDVAYIYLNWIDQEAGGAYAHAPLPTAIPYTPPTSAVFPTPEAPLTAVALPTIAPTLMPTPACNPSYLCTCPAQATSVSTVYGNYTSCIQQNLPQADCFVPNGQWNSPNLGSIQMEPQIQVWAMCTPGAFQWMQLACDQAPQYASCSKTGAGWFDYGWTGSTPTLTPTAKP